VSGPVLISAPLELVDHTESPRPVGRGRLVLHPDRLALEDGTRTHWSVPLGDISGANVEFQRAFEVSAAGRHLRVTIPSGSAWKWPWAIAWWGQRG
jgi:hypothetical protein